MPKLAIDEKNRVLVHLPAGKSYIPDPTMYVNQSRQKGGTCWYYVMNYLRARYGKKIDALIKEINDCKELHELKEDKDYQALCRGRKIESTISAFRKALTANFCQQSSAKLDEKKEMGYEREEQDLFISHLYGEECNSQTITDMKKMAPMDFSFIQQKENIYRPNLDTLIKIGLAQGGANAKKLLENLKSFEKFKNKHSTSRTFFEKAITHAYHIPFSNWHVEHKFEGLLNSLKTEGTLCAVVKVGSNTYKQALIKVDSSFGNHEVYEWPPTADIQEDGQHMILVIGAERSATGKEYVYYVDPNDESLATSANRKIYKMSYERFISTLIDFKDQRYLAKQHADTEGISWEKTRSQYGERILANAPVAFCADEKHIEEAKQQYARVIARRDELLAQKQLQDSARDDARYHRMLVTKQITDEKHQYQQNYLLKKQLEDLINDSKYWTSKTSYQKCAGGKEHKGARVPTHIHMMASSDKNIETFADFAKKAIQPSSLMKFFGQTEHQATGRDKATQEFYKMVIEVDRILKLSNDTHAAREVIESWKNQYYDNSLSVSLIRNQHLA